MRGVPDEDAVQQTAYAYSGYRKEHIPDTWFMNINRPEAYEALEDRKRPAVLAVSGSKNTGKTTLTEALVRELSKRGVKVAVIKHDGHDFTPGCSGTDSHRMKAAGALERLFIQKEVLRGQRRNKAGRRFHCLFFRERI